uniref:Reverse transcriptase domain-containing protein n=1 Tax=Hordeum vulgare subsp. vulgare TaxID=112509 RepID=A0A8I6XKE9_HORVV
MAQAAFEHFDGLLGTAVDREHTLDLAQLITPGQLGNLDEPFTSEEIWAAVCRMPPHKAPGPDGFTAEFLRACWCIIRQDILDAFEQLYALRGRGFGKLNQALLTLLPKQADAHKMGDYRPICLIHIVAKIFAKVLSLRIAPKLDSLVSRNQNAFIAGRTLHDNFVLVRQSLRMLQHLGAPCIMLKLDLTRAFDSISWPFLFEVLRQYGFGDRIREWLSILLSSASTRVMLNGVPDPPIWHRRGLRQGDSTSPLLFVLAADALARLMHRALHTGILRRLHPRRNIPTISLYADDVMMFFHAEMEEVVAVKSILGIFETASGLRVNYGKSSATTLHGGEDADALLEALGCQPAALPIMYLGIPLSYRRPSAAQMQPLVDAVAGRLPSWKAWLMNKAGRLALVKSVLSAIPIHQMLALSPPKKTLKQLEKIQRGFLWAGREAAKGGHCHVNWRTVCRPLAYGGLGIRDLERTGLALRLRWLWLSTDADRAWQGLDLQFSPEERGLFHASTLMLVGDGLTALFWEDRWLHGQSIRELAPLLYLCLPKNRRKVRTVAEGIAGNAWARDIRGVVGLQEIGQYLRTWQLVARINLSSEPDKLIWKWTANSIYSARSCYRATFHGSLTCHSWQLIWKGWAPPKVKFFHWLADLDRCWTAARLARRGLPHHTRCLLCDQEPETIRHLLISCSFARQAWHETLSWLHLPAPLPMHDASIQDWWSRARNATPAPLRKTLRSVALLVPWMIWKHRNACVFDHIPPSLSELLDRIQEEIRCWARAGDKGLRVALPPTWDVH